MSSSPSAEAEDALTRAQAHLQARYLPEIAADLPGRQRSPVSALDPRLSVVVVAWRTPHMILACLDRIRAQVGFSPGEIELILVNNGGLDEVHDQLPARVDRELRMRRNVDLCPARNAGVAFARAPIVAFVDDDGLIAPDYCARALTYFDHDPRLVALRSKIVHRRHRYFTTMAGHYDRGDAPIEDMLVTEGSSLVRRAPYLLVGGFAEEMRGHEGLDLCYRLLQHDPQARFLYAPDVVMAHDYLDGWAKFWRKMTSYAHIDDSTAQRAPGMERFLQDYFARSFPQPTRPLDERIARRALLLTRDALMAGARLRAALSSSSPQDP